jgi:hypothetical protein
MNYQHPQPQQQKQGGLVSPQQPAQKVSSQILAKLRNENLKRQLKYGK